MQRGRLGAALGVAVLCGACGGRISQATAGGAGANGNAAMTGLPGADSTEVGSGPGGSAQPGSGDSEAGSAHDTPAPATRAARLTHAQWDNSVRDLFYLDGTQSFSDGLRSDPVQNGFLFDNNSLTMEVDEALWSGYQRAAADVATYVTSDATRLAKFAPADTGDADARAARLIDDLGLRAQRRPLTAQEHAEYLALFMMGAELYAGMPAFEAGTRALIEALLQSPYFLYRIEESSDVVGDAVPLDSYEIASRLSYTLWNTMPDDTLFDAAAQDSLRDRAQVTAHAKRMLADARAQAMVLDYHAQLFQVDRFYKVSPSAAFYPNAPAGLGTLAAGEHEHFVRDLVFSQRGSYADMLTSSDTFVNADLAKLYGLAGSFGSDFVKTSLDKTQRRGIFTQIGFLAVNATSVDPDPIHRGVFLARRIACMQIAAPPANVPPLPAAAGRTNRETVEAHTQMPDTVCASCHKTLINPLGFPFEHYDAVGAYRTTDNGHPIDSSSQPTIGTQQTQVQDALELADALAANADVHRCYVQHWLEFMYGRPTAPEDDPVVSRLATDSLASRKPIADLIAELVTSPSFLQRSAEELP